MTTHEDYEDSLRLPRSTVVPEGKDEEKAARALDRAMHEFIVAIVAIGMKKRLGRTWAIEHADELLVGCAMNHRANRLKRYDMMDKRRAERKAARAGTSQAEEET